MTDRCRFVALVSTVVLLSILATTTASARSVTLIQVEKNGKRQSDVPVVVIAVTSNERVAFDYTDSNGIVSFNHLVKTREYVASTLDETVTSAPFWGGETVVLELEPGAAQAPSATKDATKEEKARRPRESSDARSWRFDGNIMIGGGVEGGEVDTVNDPIYDTSGSDTAGVGTWGVWLQALGPASWVFSENIRPLLRVTIDGTYPEGPSIDGSGTSPYDWQETLSLNTVVAWSIALGANIPLAQRDRAPELEPWVGIGMDHFKLESEEVRDLITGVERFSFSSSESLLFIEPGVGFSWPLTELGMTKLALYGSASARVYVNDGSVSVADRLAGSGGSIDYSTCFSFLGQVGLRASLGDR